MRKNNLYITIYKIIFIILIGNLSINQVKAGYSSKYYPTAGVGVSTAGLNLTLWQPVLPGLISARFMVDSGYSFNTSFSSSQNIAFSKTYDGIPFGANIKLVDDMQFKLNNHPLYSLLVDTHPFKNGFSLVTGLVYNNITANFHLNAMYHASLSVGDAAHFELGYAAGSITADFKSALNISPYFGIGYNNVTGKRGFSPYIDIGAYLFKGSLNYQVECNESKESQGVCASATQDTKDKLDSLKRNLFSGQLLLMPLIRVGLAYKF